MHGEAAADERPGDAYDALPPPPAAGGSTVAAGLLLAADTLNLQAVFVVRAVGGIWQIAAATPAAERVGLRVGGRLPGTSLPVGAGETLIAPDTGQHPVLARAVQAGSLPLRSLLAVPVPLGADSSIGALVAGDPVPRPLGQREARLLSRLGAFLGAAFEREELLARADRLAAENRRLYDEADAQRALLNAVLDNMDDAVTFVDRGRRFQVVSAGVERLFGVRPAEALGRRFEELLPEVRRCFEEPERFLTWVTRATLSRHLVQSEHFRLRHPQPAEVVLFSAPVYVRGTYRGRIYLYRDVTRQRIADRVKDDFVALVSHELRTPLTSIEGFAELLGDPGVGPLNETQLEFLGFIRTNARRLSRLVDDLLDASRLDAGLVELRREPTLVAELLPRCVAAHTAAAQRRGVDLTCEPVALDLTVRADTERLAQALDNLLDNALKFTPGGGQVHTGAAAGADGATVRIWVADSGPGIAAVEQARVFERFYRTREVDEQAIAGSGLGLYLAQRIVELHGGSIELESEPATGSAFTIVLPRAEH